MMGNIVGEFVGNVLDLDREKRSTVELLQHLARSSFATA